MNHPAFFDQVRRIRVCDPLAELLGSCEGGFIEYGYVDAVRLAGHSCPTVAGAYLVTLRALARLFPTGPAERGGVRVHLRDGDSIFRIGNAAAEAHPILGEGMSMAMQSAWLLCTCPRHC